MSAARPRWREATVHGFAVASGWAAASLVLAAVVGGILINAHPGRDNEPDPATSTAVDA